MHQTTISAAIEFIHFTLDCFESGLYCAAMFCDVSKAFDYVNHDIHLSKLKFYNFDQVSLKYFESYLTNCCQVVRKDGVTSCGVPVQFGVPQGSILGPILFLIYINHFSRKILVEILFAGDITVLVKSENGNDALDKLIIR